jgi:hypothetical protein
MNGRLSLIEWPKIRDHLLAAKAVSSTPTSVPVDPELEPLPAPIAAVLFSNVSRLR